MTEKEENILKKAMANDSIIWMPDNSTVRLVKGIARGVGEPSDCAYFTNGEYAALYNCSLSDFKRVSEI